VLKLITAKTEGPEEPVVGATLDELAREARNAATMAIVLALLFGGFGGLAAHGSGTTAIGWQ